MSLPTRTDQKFLSLALSSLCRLMPGLTGFICKSKAVVLTSFCSSPVSRARLSVKVSEMRKSIRMPVTFARLSGLTGQRLQLAKKLMDIFVNFISRHT